MKSGLIAAALLFVVLGFALAFFPRRAAWSGAALAAGLALVGATLPEVDVRIAFSGVWGSLLMTALVVYWPEMLRKVPWIGWALPTFAGLCAGLLAGQEGGVAEAGLILPMLLAALPAAWCIARGWAIVPRVITSWLFAVALLMGAIPYLIDHPGYVADHRI